METVKQIDGQLVVAGDERFGVLASRFNGFIVEQLIAGCLDALVRHGVKETAIDLVKVPGAFEMTVTAERMAASKKYHALIALGAVIRGATPHFDYIAGECVKGLSNTASKHGLPIAFGVLTVDTIEQAIERAGTKAGNKGAEAAVAAIEMVSLLRKLD